MIWNIKWYDWIISQFKKKAIETIFIHLSTFKLTFSCPKNLSELTWLDAQVPLKSFKTISYVDFSPRFFPRNVPSLKPQNLPGRIHKHRIQEFIQQIEIWFGACLLTSRVLHSSFSKEIWALKNMCLLKALFKLGRTEHGSGNYRSSKHLQLRGMPTQAPNHRPPRTPLTFRSQAPQPAARGVTRVSGAQAEESEESCNDSFLRNVGLFFFSAVFRPRFSVWKKVVQNGRSIQINVI